MFAKGILYIPCWVWLLCRWYIFYWKIVFNIKFIFCNFIVKICLICHINFCRYIAMYPELLWCCNICVCKQVTRTHKIWNVAVNFKGRHDLAHVLACKWPACICRVVIQILAPHFLDQSWLSVASCFRLFARYRVCE